MTKVSYGQLLYTTLAVYKKHHETAAFTMNFTQLN